MLYNTIHDFWGDVSGISAKSLVAVSTFTACAGLADAELDLDKEENWAEIFSLGEQQRIAFLRLLYCKPILAFLDEATSALDSETEHRLYSMLQSMCRSFVSVGHRMTIIQYHTHVLAWTEPGKWRLWPASEFNRSLQQQHIGSI